MPKTFVTIQNSPRSKVDRSDSEHWSVSIEELNPFPNSNTKKGEASFKKKKDALSIEDEALNKQASSFAETPKVGKGDQNDASKIAEQFTNMISKKRPALDGIRLSDEKSVSIKAVPGSTKNGRLAQVPAISIQNRPKIDRRRSAIMYGLLVMNWLRKKRVLPAFKILSKFRKWKQLGFRSMRNLIFRKDPGLIKDPSSSARRLSLPRRPNLATMLRRIPKIEKKLKFFSSSRADAAVNSQAFIELDSGKIRFIKFALRLVHESGRNFNLMVEHKMTDYSKLFFIPLKEPFLRSWMALTHPDVQNVEFAVGLETLMTKVLNDLIKKPRDPVFTVLRYDASSFKANGTLLLLLNHFIETKARIKKLAGRTFVNLKTLSEGQIILHSLFVLIRDHYRQVEELVCKLSVTSNNFAEEVSIQAGFRGRRGRHQKPVRMSERPIAYDLINHPEASKDQGTFASLNTLGRLSVYERSRTSLYLAETNLNPSAILRSYLYRVDNSRIAEMIPLLLSTVSVIDLKFLFFVQVYRVLATFFILSLELAPPESFEMLRVKNAHPKDLGLPGTWADKIVVKVSIYNLELHKYEVQGLEVLLRDLISTFEVSSIEDFYRSIAFGALPLHLYLQIRDRLYKNLIVEENTLLFKGFEPEPTEESHPSIHQEWSHKIEGHCFSGPYSDIDPYRKGQAREACYRQARFLQEENLAGRSPGEEQLSRQSEERLLPWGTRYKRLQIMNERNGVFYSLLRLKGCLMRVRVVYHGASDHEEIRLTTCNLETNEVYSILVKDPVTVERLVNLVMWQREVLEFCPQFLKVSTNFFIDITKALCGRNLFINNVYQDRVSVVRQETVEQTKWNVFCQLETVYLKNFFMKKVLYFATTHKILGKVYVTSTLYSSFKLAKNQLIVLLTISPVRKRFTSHQIVLNSVDLSTYFDADIFKIVHNDQGLVKLFSVVISKLVLYRCRTFSKLAIPLCWVRRLASLRYAELLQNEFDQRDLFGKKETENMEPYLKPQIYSKEVVVKMVVKFNKQYWIMTVTKNLLLDRIDIEGYVPATRRKFQCRMTTYDIDTLSAKTQIEVSKFTPHELTAIVEYCQSFQQFEEMIADRSKCKDAFENKKLHLTKANPHQGSKLLRRSPSSNQGWSNKTCNEVINQISDKNFANLKFWMTLLARAKLLLKHSDLLIEIESFRGVLQEHIWQNVCITDKLKFEICIDLEAERSEVRSSKIVKMFSPINIDSLTNYAFLLKVIFIEQDQQVHVDKVILDGLLKIYGLLLQDKLTKISKLIHMDEESPRIPEELDGEFGQRSRSTVLKSTKLLTDRFNQGFVLKLRQLRLVDLVELCRILEVNIIDNILGNYMGVIDSQLTYFNNEKILSREIIYKEKFERRMKLNSRLCLEIMSDPHYKDYNDILLCRTVFTVRPLQTLAILFNKKYKEFSFHIYDNQNCIVQTTVKEASEIEYHMPHALILIDNMKFAEVARRLVALYKNSLLATDFIAKS